MPPGREKGAHRRESRAVQGLGRSRGGLTTKIHTIGDGRGRNLASRLTPGQAGDSPQLIGLLDEVKVPGGALGRRSAGDTCQAKIGVLSE